MAADNKKKMIYLGVIVVCLGGAGLSYYMLSGSPVKPATSTQQAHADAISQSMDKENAPAAPAMTQPPQGKAGRSMAFPGSK